MSERAGNGDRNGRERVTVDFPAMRTDRGQRQLRAEVQTRWQA
ncbi:MAG: hypothetical protein ACI9OB_000452, partial [Nonlabens sp.]